MIEGAADADEARRRRDGDEAGDRAAGGPDDADLAPRSVAGEDPGDRGRGGGDVGDDERAGGEAARRSTAEPALKPNQPNHRSPAPRTVIGTSCGSMLSPFGGALPIIRATTRADTPELMWTTVPPAKSSAPSLNSQPSADQTQWASGE